MVRIDCALPSIANCRIIRGKSAVSTQCIQENQKQKDWLAVDAVPRELLSIQNSLLTGKNTGNYRRLLETLVR